MTMKSMQRIASLADRGVVSLAAASIVFGLIAFPAQSLAAVSCAAASQTADSDGDGFTDAQECAGTALGTLGFMFPGKNSGLARAQRLDPDSKDLFVVYVPVLLGSYLKGQSQGGAATAIPDPFGTVQAYGKSFVGLSALGVTVHTLNSTQLDPFGSRLLNATQRAIVVFEDLDNTADTLGFCPYGTPNRVDGGVCTIYTQRIWDFIVEDTCTDPITRQALSVVTGTGAASSLADMFVGYTIGTILHEVGHTL